MQPKSEALSLLRTQLKTNSTLGPAIGHLLVNFDKTVRVSDTFFGRLGDMIILTLQCDFLHP